jgi:kynureninase
MKRFLIPSIAILLTAASMAAQAAETTATSNQPQQQAAGDSLSLSRSQQRIAWRDLDRHAWQQSAPSSFTPSVGAVVPDEITLRAMPRRAANQLPSLKPYDFAVLPKQVLIINPGDKKIVDVIGRNA